MLVGVRMHGPDDPDRDLDVALEQARTRFAADFAQGCRTIDALIGRASIPGDVQALDELCQLLHRFGGTGGTIGLPTVSARARELEDMVREARRTGLDAAEARRLLGVLREAYRTDVST